MTSQQRHSPCSEGLSHNQVKPFATGPRWIQAKATFDYLREFTWRRVVCWLRHKHPHANWRWLRRRYLPGWWPTDGEVRLFDLGAIAVTRYRYRAARIPTPWAASSRTIA
jgi:hypothetical protein